MEKTTVTLRNVRLSFPHLKSPSKSSPESEPKYSCDFIMSDKHPGWTLFMNAYRVLAEDKWGSASGSIIQHIANDKKLRCYGYGNEKINTKEYKVYTGYEAEDCRFINASNYPDDVPQMIDASGKPVLNKSQEWETLARALVGGVWVNAVISPWVQDNKWGKGIRCNIEAIQFYAHGEPLGRGTPIDVSNMFESVQNSVGDFAPPIISDII